MNLLRAALSDAVGALSAVAGLGGSGVDVSRLNVSAMDVSGMDVSGMADDDLLAIVAEIEGLGRLVDALRVTSAGEVDARSGRERGQEGLAQRHGFTRSSHLVEFAARVSSAESSRRVRLGAALRPSTSLCGETLPAAFPLVAVALAGGDIGTDSARIIVDCLSQAGTSASHSDREAAEAALVAQAGTTAPDLVAVQARVWREALDPDGAEPREDAIRRKRALHIGRETGGLTPFSGLAEPTLAALLRSALSEGSGQGVLPRFLSDADAPAHRGHGRGATQRPPRWHRCGVARRRA